jgi:DNA helicase-2/ATP-dependent DNA helicase PcrA
VVVSTIHSFCQDVIRQFPELFLQYKAGTPIDDVEGLEILKSVIDEMVESKELEALVSDYDRYFYLRDIKSRISTLKQEAISREEFLQIIENQKQVYQEVLSLIKPTLKKYEKTKSDQEKHILKLTELALIYDAFNKKLQEKSYYDFNDMIQYVVRVFSQNEEVRYFYAEKFQFIMLDEYQDTNNAQNKIIELILSV